MLDCRWTNVHTLPFFLRISPRPSPVMQNSTLPPSLSPEPHPEPETLLEMELDIPPSPPPVEETLASRRAKRQAILAKYANTGVSVSPSPVTTTGFSSAVQALQTPSTVSDHASHDSSLPQQNTANGSSGKYFTSIRSMFSRRI